MSNEKQGQMVSMKREITMKKREAEFAFRFSP
jgi:hypothetical protein